MLGAVEPLVQSEPVCTCCGRGWGGRCCCAGHARSTLLCMLCVLPLLGTSPGCRGGDGLHLWSCCRLGVGDSIAWGLLGREEGHLTEQGGHGRALRGLWGWHSCCFRCRCAHFRCDTDQLLP